MTTQTLSAVLAETRKRFADAGLPDAATDARVLVAGLLDLSSTDMVLNGERVLSVREIERIDGAAERRIAREPVHRIVGFREFYGLRFMLSPETLEPRPDTEVLVDAVLQHARQLFGSRPGRILDLGTGTGAILLALLSELPGFSGVAADISAGALETARLNAQINHISERFSAVQTDWFAKIEGRFDIIVSNPPYIKTDIIAELEPDVRIFDPDLALDGGTDGLDAYRAIANGAAAFLSDDGVIGLEIGYDQKQAVTDLFLTQGYTLIESVTDYGGNDRALIFARQKA
ncbi:peptide chain release factor N(5)-glutamine methyltransferase [Rhizobium sp. SL86]|uniref:peptide chain release factor N(5)-glutamine methyltransferase n=1 Tax=Rhizobium sp. SL86 TaxID=2995148 RepID=UPI0022737B92|nr:peptide chain release factor N(5)-glutamine methyltransferase [Rhizobium sp. SL86]MCY1665824.1 peptide chain release factor N(5)-glutamine methyltransferase [Rhizobium sp. SL86]